MDPKHIELVGEEAIEIAGLIISTNDNRELFIRNPMDGTAFKMRAGNSEGVAISVENLKIVPYASQEPGILLLKQPEAPKSNL